MTQTNSQTPAEPLELPRWSCPAPLHFDSAWPRWVKFAVPLAALGLAFLVDKPVADWALAKKPLELSHDLKNELMMLEQFGQWVSSVLVIALVAVLDRRGKPKALAMALGCLATVLLCYLLKDLFGRPRPYVLGGDGAFDFFGPAYGFTKGTAYGSFPSAHTTGSWALAAGLSWFYPRGRAFFYALAVQVAVQRILHADHYVSDTIAGALLAVTMTRLTLAANAAGRVIAALPARMQRWWLGE